MHPFCYVTCNLMCGFILFLIYSCALFAHILAGCIPGTEEIVHLYNGPRMSEASLKDMGKTGW